jgi:hypothetical protein
MLDRSIAIDKLLGKTRSWLLTILLATQLAPAARAQDQPTAPVQPPEVTLPTEPAKQTVDLKLRIPPPATLYENLALRGGLVCGGGSSISSVATKPTTQCGALIGLDFLETEVGVMGPQANRSNVSGYLSENIWAPLHPNSKRGSAVAVGGYTRMFETGHAVDYGIAYLMPTKRINEMRYVQFEVRDYFAFANPNQHNVVFRVAWIFGSGDEP